ncbi:type II toxin-antitoxin system VapC family toxin [Uliginosibacterium sp. 31-12]|uniref:type II toxin-antitoxin system VapC family toxin n=1 Tax=Uliginosibacterium sp. 31-12 TaxID=3062781 RepID=UPI0026E42D88|nr:type II toxin-antitoxin system VapC family toxin [Uliginosibacterium sp. 31-12]MDO6386621.1 type II toxin-antitoxin system VapC family toxin [Uliginosibacterium sp. 31-12]
MRRVVPDASVLLKWVLHEGESHLDQALALQADIIAGRVQALLPPLWYFEVGNTLGRRFPEQAPRALAGLRAFAIEERMLGVEAEVTALRLMRECGVTFYDAAYHALAIESGATFVTADARYLEAARAWRHASHLMDWA